MTSRAITQYHKAKMEEVNKIIRELWIDIYKGGGTKATFKNLVYSQISAMYMTFAWIPQHDQQCCMQPKNTCV